MTSRAIIGILGFASLSCVALSALGAQQALIEGSAATAQQRLADARSQGAEARQRAERLELQARSASVAVERTEREAAALAARIQEAEAALAVHEARIALIARQRAALADRLAERRQPLVRLTAALQRLARRPPALALFRPGSVRDTMHMRALLETMAPEIERRTQALRSELARSRQLERAALAEAKRLRAGETELESRRQRLAGIETRQRLASREANSLADREAERALALAERARDLGDLMGELEQAGALRQQLAALPGPVLRPARPQEAKVADAPMASATPRAIEGYMLPVAGRLVTGFGDAVQRGPRSQGVTLAARGGAQVVAPAAGRVAFAGPYQGFGRIVIIEHAGGWTTLVTGMAQVSATVGKALVAGSPLGTVGAGEPRVTIELRRDGMPVNPLLYLAGS